MEPYHSILLRENPRNEMTYNQICPVMTSDRVTPRLDDVQNSTKEELDVITNSATDNDVSELKPPERLLIDTSSTKVDKRRLYNTYTRLATWNVRTMSQEKLPILTRE